MPSFFPSIFLSFAKTNKSFTQQFCVSEPVIRTESPSLISWSRLLPVPRRQTQEVLDLRLLHTCNNEGSKLDLRDLSAQKIHGKLHPHRGNHEPCEIQDRYCRYLCKDVLQMFWQKIPYWEVELLAKNSRLIGKKSNVSLKTYNETNETFLSLVVAVCISFLLSLMSCVGKGKHLSPGIIYQCWVCLICVGL